jgi:hypothetical protein
MIDALNVDLTKWPHMVVAGRAVTKEQAAEIIIRTTSLWFSSNSTSVEKELYKIIDKTFGFEYNPKTDGTIFDQAFNRKSQQSDFLKHFNKLDLCYLQNHRVLSCWVGGPHGYLNWDGTVGCNNYNIGKWPSVTEIYNEWELIAETFPYLDLQCQLMSGESCEEDTTPVIEYIIKEGKVEVKIPTEKLVSNVHYVDPTDIMIQNMYSSTRELGCTFKQFEDALQYLKVQEK